MNLKLIQTISIRYCKITKLNLEEFIQILDLESKTGLRYTAKNSTAIKVTYIHINNRCDLNINKVAMVLKIPIGNIFFKTHRSLCLLCYVRETA